MDPYAERPQTKAKHFILRSYLQALAFKVLRFWDIAYIDGFSGPWESATDDLSDTSFMIALNVLKDAQANLPVDTRRQPKVRCFFSEKQSKAYERMTAAVAPFNRPEENFEIKTFCGDFVDAVDDIQKFIGTSFPLIFIDPTGWTGYPLDKIAPLFASRKCETLINFMYDHINRFANHPDENIIASLDPILGGQGWKNRLDPNVKPGLAVEKLFRETLKDAGNFTYVVSTKIDKSTQNRPHFVIAYATKDRAGLLEFRETEYLALRGHARSRSNARMRDRETKHDTADFFEQDDADHHEASIDDIVVEQKQLAKERLLQLLGEALSARFADIVDTFLQEFMLRETNIKDVCVELAREGKIKNSWGGGTNKPKDQTQISLSPSVGNELQDGRSPSPS